MVCKPNPRKSVQLCSMLAGVPVMLSTKMIGGVLHSDPFSLAFDTTDAIASTQ